MTDRIALLLLYLALAVVMIGSTFAHSRSQEYVDPGCIQQIRFTKPGKQISVSMAQFNGVQVEFSCVSVKPAHDFKVPRSVLVLR